jgi:hypothetical protein
MSFPFSLFYHRSVIMMMTDLENRIGDVRCLREEKMSRKLVPPSLYCPLILSVLLVYI